MTKTLKYSLYFLAGIVMANAFSVGVQIAYSAATITHGTTPDRYVYHSFFSATTTNATSTDVTSETGYLVTEGAKKVTLYFTHGGAATSSTGTGVFRVQGTPDGTNWHDFNKLVQNVATSSTAWQLGSVAVGAATTTTITSMDLTHETFYGVRCIVVETGTEGAQGEHTCAASAEF